MFSPHENRLTYNPTKRKNIELCREFLAHFHRNPRKSLNEECIHDGLLNNCLNSQNNSLFLSILTVNDRLFIKGGYGRVEWVGGWVGQPDHELCDTWTGEHAASLINSQVCRRFDTPPSVHVNRIDKVYLGRSALIVLPKQCHWWNI